MSDVVSADELRGMRILVAFLAFLGSILKVHITQSHFHVRRLVAANARRRAVRSYQRVRSLVVVEANQVLPGFL